jgi:hypothetical protein
MSHQSSLIQGIGAQLYRRQPNLPVLLLYGNKRTIQVDLAEYVLPAPPEEA